MLKKGGGEIFFIQAMFQDHNLCSTQCKTMLEWGAEGGGQIQRENHQQMSPRCFKGE